MLLLLLDVELGVDVDLVCGGPGNLTGPGGKVPSFQAGTRWEVFGKEWLGRKEQHGGGRLVWFGQDCCIKVTMIEERSFLTSLVFSGDQCP